MEVLTMNEDTCAALRAEVARLAEEVAELRAALEWSQVVIQTGELRCRRLVVVDHEGNERVTADIHPGDNSAALRVVTGDVDVSLVSDDGSANECGTRGAGVMVGVAGNVVAAFQTLAQEKHRRVLLDADNGATGFDTQWSAR